MFYWLFIISAFNNCLIWALIKFGRLVNIPAGTTAVSAVLMVRWTLACGHTGRCDLFPFPLGSHLKYSSSLRAWSVCLTLPWLYDTVISLACVLFLCVLLSCLHPISHLSLFLFAFFLATSSAQLEDLSFLNNQRAAGHRGSVRKHNTAGRPSDDIKGILRLNVEVRSMYKYSFGAETPTAPYQNYQHHLFNVFLT